jgi:hypothetical protein
MESIYRTRRYKESAWQEDVARAQQIATFQLGVYISKCCEYVIRAPSTLCQIINHRNRELNPMLGFLGLSAVTMRTIEVD